jgi:hypothetical protein
MLRCLAVVLVVGACAQTPTDDSDFTTPDAIVIGSGNDQSVTAGQPVPLPLRVIVFTPDDLKCNGCAVAWMLSPGGFTSGTVFVQTSVVGEAALQITGIGSPGNYTITASIANGASVNFSLSVR